MRFAVCVCLLQTHSDSHNHYKLNTTNESTNRTEWEERTMPPPPIRMPIYVRCVLCTDAGHKQKRTFDTHLDFIEIEIMCFSTCIMWMFKIFFATPIHSALALILFFFLFTSFSLRWWHSDDMVVLASRNIYLFIFFSFHFRCSAVFIRSAFHTVAANICYFSILSFPFIFFSSLLLYFVRFVIYLSWARVHSFGLLIGRWVGRTFGDCVAMVVSGTRSCLCWQTNCKYFAFNLIIICMQFRAWCN